jgi:hypothetical protein
MEERHYPETAAGAPFYAAAMDERQVSRTSPGPIDQGLTLLFLAITIVVGVVCVVSTAYGVWQFETYVYPPGCALERIHACAAWLWDYSSPLRNHPH